MSIEEIESLEVLDRVNQETLRFKGPGAMTFPREVVKEMTLGGKKIPVGAHIFLMMMPVQNSDKIHEKGAEFNPERFTPEKAKKIEKINNIPFSYGRRRCIGAELGNLNVKMMLVVALANFEFDWCSKVTPYPYFHVPGTY